MTDKKVNEIMIIFENCEAYTIKASMFKYLVLDEITERRSVNCYQYENGEVNTIKSCNYFHIEILEKGLREKGWLEENKTLRKRLQGNDITSIELIYDDKSKEQIFVPWNEKYDYYNEYQTNTYKNDSVEIEIKE